MDPSLNTCKKIDTIGLLIEQEETNLILMQDNRWNRNSIFEKTHYTGRILDFDNEESVIEFTERLVVVCNSPRAIGPVRTIPSLEIMMRNGLVPSYFVEDDEFDEHLAYCCLKGYSDTDINFWMDEPPTNKRDPSKDILWYYFPLDYVRTNSLNECKGLLLSMMLPSAVYKSKRPKTDMMMFRLPSSLTSCDTKEWRTIPVTRYAEGMTRSLFYGKAKEDCNFCGTFYYYETESTTLLAYRKSFRAFNKVQAYRDLGGVYTEESYVLEEWTARKLPENLIMSRADVMNITKYQNVEGSKLQQRDYAGNILKLYGAEDRYDQKLCKLAKSKGYDIVILTNMVGGFQVVTEILDTRDRVESFRSLIYK